MYVVKSNWLLIIINHIIYYWSIKINFSFVPFFLQSLAQLVYKVFPVFQRHLDGKLLSKNSSNWREKLECKQNFTIWDTRYTLSPSPPSGRGSRKLTKLTSVGQCASSPHLLYDNCIDFVVVSSINIGQLCW